MFYRKVILKLLVDAKVNSDDSILVVAGGNTDKEVFLGCGFTNVIISNIGDSESKNDYYPYKWESQDAEQLTYPDNYFDWVAVHAGLHHCASPHKAMCEMLRVSKKGIIVFESRDSVVNKIANAVGLVPEYELEPLVLSDGKYGGYRNSHIPNYVYRWTEREVKKTVASYLPIHKHSFHFFYDFTLPVQRLSMSPNPLKRLMVNTAVLMLPVIKFFFRKQGNNFCFVVSKQGELQPWLLTANNKIIFNADYAINRFRPENYTGAHKKA